MSSKWSISALADAIIALATEGQQFHGSTSPCFRSGLRNFTSPTNSHAISSEKESAFLLQVCFQIGCTTSTLAPTRSRRSYLRFSSPYVLMISHTSLSLTSLMSITNFFFFCDECIWRTLEGPLWLHHAHAGSHDYADGRSTRECECALVSCQALVQGTQHSLQVQFPQDDNVQPQRWKFEFLESGIPNLSESWSPQSISIWMSYVGS